MTTLIGGVFVAVYIGMAAGRVPWLAVDRTGIALTGMIVLLVSGAIGVPQLPRALELPTLLLLFALMILGGHFAAAHCFDFLGAWLSRVHARPVTLLGATVLVGGGLSVVLVNDIVVFAFAPLLCMALPARGLDPRPFLLALAGSANAGSTASLIGNPQNILIGEIGNLDFLAYFVTAAVPAVAALLIVFAVIATIWRHSLRAASRQSGTQPAVEVHPWLMSKSFLATAALILLMVFYDGQREVAALGVAAVLIVGRQITATALLRQVDWSLLVLIASLFVVTAAFTSLPAAPELIAWLRNNELLPYRLSLLIPFSVVASNTIGNVPAVVLLLQAVENIPPEVLTALAVFTTLSGNLLLTGSLANIIVAERASAHGVRLTFGDFAKVGIPATALSIAVAALWFYTRGYLAF
ncbi:MAG: SLC13 family permease [Gammaproteobacteria bacterium]